MTRNEAKEILQAVKFLLPIEAYSDMAQEALDTAIEALERKNGKWIEDREMYKVYRCSVCDDCYQDVGYGYNYCPNCGADMRGDGKEDK